MRVFNALLDGREASFEKFELKAAKPSRAVEANRFYGAQSWLSVGTLLE
jgi:hypothetical protein